MNNDTTNPLDQIITILESVKSDYNKFYDGGNSAAGTRVRKAMQEVKNTAHGIRVHVQATKNER
jgi:hypothetical protein|tara:strand:+ start:499 stop:690 length:192 start_codon:yes stop_codon:yes gene_type:complete